MKLRHIAILAAVAAALPLLSPLVQKIHATVVESSASKPETLVEEIVAVLDESDGEENISPTALTEIWKKKLLTLDARIADFRKRYPDHPLRWDVLFHEANSFEIRTTLHLDLPKTARPSGEIFTEILAAPDASKDIKAQASAARLGHMADDAHDKKIALPVWEKMLAEHLAAFPEMEDNTMLADARIELVSELDAPRLAAVLEELAKSPNAEIAELANARILHEKTLADLRSKPFDLAFKAIDGTEVDLAKMRGKVVLVDFWASWNAPSAAQSAPLLKAYTKLHSKGFEIIGISLDDEASTLKTSLAEQKIPWPQHFDGKGWESPLARKYAIESIPTLWLLNKKGMIVDTTATAGDFEEKIERLLAEEP